MSSVLFFSRLFLYLVAVLVPAAHPAVVVGYEQTGVLIWFVLVPLEMGIAWWGAPPRLARRWWFLAAATPLLIVAIFVGIDASPLLPVVAGVLAFGLTALLFHFGPRFRVLFALEQLILGGLYFRLLTFSRSSEEMALGAAAASQLIFVLLILTFLLHGMLVSFTLAGGGYGPAKWRVARAQRVQPGRGADRQELLLFLAVAIPILLLFALALPPDFVQHNPVVNLLGREVDPPRRSLNDEADGLLGDRGTQGRNNGEGEYDLRGIDAADWNRTTSRSNRNGSGQGPDEQRAVMVVASQLDPVYAAEGYRDRFDPVAGFTYASEPQPLNELVRMRLAGTWRNDNLPADLERYDVPVNVYSTLPDRVIPYVPRSAEPAIYQPRYYPFSFSFHNVAAVSLAGDRQLSQTPPLTAADLNRLAQFLEIELAPEHEEAFRRHLSQRVGELPAAPHARILAIMNGFRTFQYELGYEDDFSAAHMARFVSETLSGDCVEFANTAAILGRMVGIPSRVVTGYLATSALQNPAHLRGLAVLQAALPQLQRYRLDELYLVTTSHRHAWVQFYLSGYGWVDFEPTSYAIPPPPGMDPNERRVVIPIIDPRDPPRSARFPWELLWRVVARLALGALAGLYVLRCGMEFLLAWRSRGHDRRAVRARYRLLLMRLAARGYQLKPVAMTAIEYGALVPELGPFAALYTQCRYVPESALHAPLLEELEVAYTQTLTAATNGKPLWRIRRLLSLRGLYYV